MTVLKVIAIYWVVSIIMALMIRYGKIYVGRLKGREEVVSSPFLHTVIKAPIVPPVLIIFLIVATTVERDIWWNKCKEIADLISIE